jgi:hypothetical protein
MELQSVSKQGKHMDYHTVFQLGISGIRNHQGDYSSKLAVRVVIIHHSCICIGLFLSLSLHVPNSWAAIVLL